MTAPFDFKGRRLPLAHVFYDWRTANEAAAEMGTETGSVFGLVKRMHKEGVLEADSNPPTRGTQYRLTHEARVALEQIDRSQVAPAEIGRLASGQRLLIASGQPLVEIEEVLAESANVAAISWAAWIGASWLIAMSPGSDGQALRKLSTLLERAGYRCERGRVDELLSARSLRRQSEANLSQADAGR